MTKYIIKSNGEKEPYDEEKIKSSIIKAGSSPDIAAEAARTITRKVKDNMSTDEIYNKALSRLKVLEPGVALKYSLKKAIMNIGPEGYAFEKYTAKILEEYGFSTEVGQFVRGYCVEHEVDVVAKKEGKIYLVECKYHNSPGIKSDVKIALYIHSRFLDIEKARREKDSSNHLEAWLVTNTKCTSDAIKYANCVGLKIMAWHYPEVKNLQYYIETKKLYPVSILSTINKKQKEILLDSGIILIKELENYGVDNLTRLIHANHWQASKILNEVSIIL
ncbi:MAG: ATP cone domain-containing protein [Actinomycetota bacterium]